MVETWRLILDPPLTRPLPGPLNMAIDEAILTAVSTGQAPPTLRLYAWQPACLSLGYAQPGRDVDRERLAAQGWQIVRRMTGGRAILHAAELTYSVALPLKHPLAAGGILESYRRLSAALLRAVQTIGLDAQADPRTERQGQRPGPVCFEVPSDYEITAGGKKLIGSAQVRRHSAMLQHGSLPLAGDLGAICDVLTFPDESSREQAKQRIHERATTLSEAVGAEIDWDSAAKVIQNAFARSFTVQFASEDILRSIYGADALEGPLFSAEWAHAHVLDETRYRADSWTFRS